MRHTLSQAYLSATVVFLSFAGCAWIGFLAALLAGQGLFASVALLLTMVLAAGAVCAWSDFRATLGGRRWQDHDP